MLARLRSRLAATLATAAWSVPPSAAMAQESLARIPLVSGLTIVSTEEWPEHDRDNVVRLERVDSSGIHYVWRFMELTAQGDTLVDARERWVRASDLAGAPRIDWVFAADDDLERPGYTAWSLSSAVYVALRDQGSTRFTTVGVDAGPGRLGALGIRRQARRVRHKGTLARMSPAPAPFPLLVDGRRVMVPALHARGALADGAGIHDLDLWVLADSAHPLLLKGVRGDVVFQVTRIDFPAGGSAELAPGEGALAGGGGKLGEGRRVGGRLRLLERELAAACRVELPGVYFAFNSALLDPASDPALAQLAAVLAGHPDWTLVVEGHTDSVGTAAANQTLSERRAEAVRARLADRHGVDTRAWKVAGFGASRPREPNNTIEGRARNRRVELVRACPERR